MTIRPEPKQKLDLSPDAFAGFRYTMQIRELITEAQMNQIQVSDAQKPNTLLHWTCCLLWVRFIHPITWSSLTLGAFKPRFYSFFRSEIKISAPLTHVGVKRLHKLLVSDSSVPGARCSTDAPSRHFVISHSGSDVVQLAAEAGRAWRPILRPSQSSPHPQHRSRTRAKEPSGAERR